MMLNTDLSLVNDPAFRKWVEVYAKVLVLYSTRTLSILNGSYELALLMVFRCFTILRHVLNFPHMRPGGLLMVD